MKCPSFVKNLVKGRVTIRPEDLRPRRVPWLKNKLAVPLIPVDKARYYARHILKLGLNPADYNLGSCLAGYSDSLEENLQSKEAISQKQQQPPNQHYDLPYKPPAQGKYERDLPARLAKIDFIKTQMAKMPKIIEEWRAAKRQDKAKKEKKYPY